MFIYRNKPKLSTTTTTAASDYSVTKTHHEQSFPLQSIDLNSPQHSRQQSQQLKPITTVTVPVTVVVSPPVPPVATVSPTPDVVATATVAKAEEEGEDKENNKVVANKPEVKSVAAAVTQKSVKDKNHQGPHSKTEKDSKRPTTVPVAPVSHYSQSRLLRQQKEKEKEQEKEKEKEKEKEIAKKKPTADRKRKLTSSSSSTSLSLTNDRRGTLSPNSARAMVLQAVQEEVEKAKLRSPPLVAMTSSSTNNINNNNNGITPAKKLSEESLLFFSATKQIIKHSSTKNSSHNNINNETHDSNENNNYLENFAAADPPSIPSSVFTEMDLLSFDEIPPMVFPSTPSSSVSSSSNRLSNSNNNNTGLFTVTDEEIDLINRNMDCTNDLDIFDVNDDIINEDDNKIGSRSYRNRQSICFTNLLELTPVAPSAVKKTPSKIASASKKSSVKKNLKSPLERLSELLDMDDEGSSSSKNNNNCSMDTVVDHQILDDLELFSTFSSNSTRAIDFEALVNQPEQSQSFCLEENNNSSSHSSQEMISINDFISTCQTYLENDLPDLMDENDNETAAKKKMHEKFIVARNQFQWDLVSAQCANSAIHWAKKRYGNEGAMNLVSAK
jgi:hypothetical protein